MELWCPDGCLSCDAQTIGSIYCSECTKHHKQNRKSHITTPRSRRTLSGFQLQPAINFIDHPTRKRPAPTTQDNVVDSPKRVRRSLRKGSADGGLSPEQKELLFCYSLSFDPVRSAKRQLIHTKSNVWDISAVWRQIRNHMASESNSKDVYYHSSGINYLAGACRKGSLIT